VGHLKTWKIPVALVKFCGLFDVAYLGGAHFLSKYGVPLAFCMLTILFFLISSECYWLCIVSNCIADNLVVEYTYYVFFYFQIRDNLKQLLRNLNSQKNCIKKHGIVVDGRKYKIKFTGITKFFDYSVRCVSWMQTKWTWTFCSKLSFNQSGEHIDFSVWCLCIYVWEVLSELGLTVLYFAISTSVPNTSSTNFLQ